MNIFFTEHVRATASTSNADAKKNHTNIVWYHRLVNGIYIRTKELVKWKVKS